MRDTDAQLPIRFRAAPDIQLRPNNARRLGNGCEAVGDKAATWVAAHREVRL